MYCYLAEKLNISKIQSMLDKQSNELKNNITLEILKEKKLVNKKYSKLKILGSGEIKKNIQISANFASKQAQEKIEKVKKKFFPKNLLISSSICKLKKCGIFSVGLLK